MVIHQITAYLRHLGLYILYPIICSLEISWTLDVLNVSFWVMQQIRRFTRFMIYNIVNSIFPGMLSFMKTVFLLIQLILKNKTFLYPGFIFQLMCPFLILIPLPLMLLVPYMIPIQSLHNLLIFMRLFNHLQSALDTEPNLLG